MLISLYVCCRSAWVRITIFSVPLVTYCPPPIFPSLNEHTMSIKQQALRKLDVTSFSRAYITLLIGPAQLSQYNLQICTRWQQMHYRRGTSYSTTYGVIIAKSIVTHHDWSCTQKHNAWCLCRNVFHHTWLLVGTSPVSSNHRRASGMGSPPST